MAKMTEKRHEDGVSVILAAYGRKTLVFSSEEVFVVKHGEDAAAV
jgi:hypothetical protein